MDALFSHIVGVITLWIVVKPNNSQPPAVDVILHLDDKASHPPPVMCVADASPGAMSQRGGVLSVVLAWLALTHCYLLWLPRS